MQEIGRREDKRSSGKSSSMPTKRSKPKLWVDYRCCTEKISNSSATIPSRMICTLVGTKAMRRLHVALFDQHKAGWPCNLVGYKINSWVGLGMAFGQHNMKSYTGKSYYVYSF
ncbi:hypothetical protein ElyMa_004683100 [Elysia marginata]|uniref:Uncharacterized protein n=1 Tax=Elysia marginata TaxID=1093978 RepID=A0AAV4I5E7_9GAST|nr:hypothetical protein ElyMa_004683100 [Elysia marginata]